MRITRYFWVLLGLLFTSQFAYGQYDKLYRPNWSIKYNPIAIVNHTPGIELGLEHTIGTDASIHIGGSFINDFGIPMDQDFSGFKLIGEYRMYSPWGKKPNNTFLAAQFNYKEVVANGRTYLERANGNFQQLTDITVDNRSLDFLLAVGQVHKIWRWLSFEVSVVGGAKQLKLSSDELNEDAFLRISEENIFDFSPDSPGHYWYPVLRFQFKVNFEIN